MIGLFTSVMVQLVIIAIQLTVWLIRLMAMLVIAIAQAAAQGFEAYSRQRRMQRSAGGVLASRRRLPFPADLRWMIFKRDNYECVQCGSTLDLTVDHIHPVSMGGTNDPSNLQTMCRSCNCSKGARILV